MVKAKNDGGSLARGFRIGKLGFGLVGSYLGYQAQRVLLGESDERQSSFRRKAARRVTGELGALKGPAMKLGQLLSMEGALPQEALEELSQLQMQAPGMHATLARAQFKSSVGKYPEEVFREFGPEPFAAASLGQVHRAVTRDGKRVAVKIQYPAIREAIENDFTLLRSATLPTQVSGHVPVALLDEVERGLMEETDYKREADHLDFFGVGLAGLDYLTVPRPVREFCTDRVLTMSFVEGERFHDFLGRKPSQALRNLLGKRLLEVYEVQLQRLKLIHADSHPGNYLFQPDGRVGLVDFGCVKKIMFDELWLRRAFQERVWKKGEAQARDFVAKLFGPRVSYRRARRILPLMEESVELLYPNGPDEDLVCDFSRDSKLLEKIKKVAAAQQRMILKEKLINPDFAFVLRAEYGLRYLLGELRAVVNVTEVWRKVEGK
ncbi:MAG TPA: AarF/UbiB family protein [Verrucomicrobiae bacterium]